MTGPEHEVLPGEVPDVFQPFFSPHDLEHTGKPVDFGPLHHHFPFPQRIQKIFIAFGKLFAWD